MSESPFDAQRSSILPQLRFDELLDELQTRLAAVRGTRERVHQLLDAVISVASGLDVDDVLVSITQAAVSLVDARYGAFGVIGAGDRLSRFVTVGLTDAEIAAIGSYPTGQGLLGVLIHDPQVLSVEDLTANPLAYGFPRNHPPMRSFLGAPVRVRNAVYGNLYLTEKRDAAVFDATTKR